MTFVWTPWYIVMALCVVGIVVSLVFFFRMDKKDRIIIDKFLKDSEVQNADVQDVQSAEKTVVEEKTE